MSENNKICTKCRKRYARHGETVCAPCRVRSCNLETVFNNPVEDIMDFVEPEEYLKELDEDRIRVESIPDPQGNTSSYLCNKDALEAYKKDYPNSPVECPVGYRELIIYEKGYKSAISAREKEIEELKNCLHLVVEETGHREAAMLLLTLTTRTESTP